MKFSEARTACQLLLEQHDFDLALQVLRHVLPTIRTSEEWAQVLEIVECIPESTYVASVEAAQIYARTLNRNHRLTDVLEFGAKVSLLHATASTALVQLECAGVLIELYRYSEACQVLEETVPYLEGEPLGIALRQLGLVLYYLDMPWQDSFAQARKLLSGGQLGRALLDEGFCLEKSKLTAESRSVWLEALPYFRSDLEMLVRTRYNLGISALRDLDPSAERHFLEAIRLAKNPRLVESRADVFNGLGATQRMLGEWDRAAYSYEKALEHAAVAFHRTESYLGIARTLRLAGRFVASLEILEVALEGGTLKDGLFHVARAKNFLALGQINKARESLEHVGQLVSEYDKWLERIARAEFARRDGRLDEAVRLLDGLPVHTLHAREEVRQWPQLFALLAAAGKPVPEPLEYVQGTRVRVVALGVLQVTVNGRDVPIAPTSKAGELLVFLLEQGGAASLEVIADALYPDSTHERARKSIWMLVKSLRDALGWSDAVRALRGAYQLDPGATWAYDVREARLGGAPTRTFLSGVYSEWALEVGRELEGLVPEPRRNPDLN